MIHLVINPAAGNGSATRVGERIVALLKEENTAFDVSFTEYPGHATALAKEAAEKGIGTVVAVGGDGTVCETARGLVGMDAALGIIPAGTGNDVIKMLGTPRKPEEALRFVLEHPAHEIDAGWVNDMLFLNECGTGFDVCVLDYTLVAKKYVRGMLPYLWGVLRTIFTYKPIEVTVEVDGEGAFQKKLLLLAVANGRFIGGGMDVAPKSVPNDGLLDLILIDSMPNWRMPAQLLKLLTGRILEIPGTVCRRCKSVTVTMNDAKMRLNLDGEIVPVPHATFRVAPGALKVHW